MHPNYIFYSAYFDVELLRLQTLTLKENDIDFKIIPKSSHRSAKAPLSISFEAELHLLETDFEKACELLNALNE